VKRNRARKKDQGHADRGGKGGQDGSYATRFALDPLLSALTAPIRVTLLSWTAPFNDSSACQGCDVSSAFTSNICDGPIGVNVVPTILPICAR